MNEAGSAKPFIKSAGGKRKLVPLIREMMPQRFNQYHEPFIGGGALFFDLQPKSAFISDLNEKLIAAYQAVQLDVEKVIERLKRFSNDRESFELIRKRNFNAGDIFQRAAEYIYCNKVCFNGLYRVNKSGQFNVPFGKYAKPNFCDEVGLRAASKALQGVTITAKSYNRASEFIQPGDFVYCDPPYEPVSATASFTEYTAGGFTKNSQEALRDVMLFLKQKGVHVIISNSAAPLIWELYQKPDWTIRQIQAKRSINCDGDGRGDVTELLIY